MAKGIDFEAIDKGSPLDGLSIPALTRVSLGRFAGASDDYNPMHLDDKVASANGKNSVFAPANLVMGYVGRMVESSLAGASLRRFGLRMLKLVWPGDVLTCRGVVIDKREEGKDLVLDADVWADNQRGETVAKGRVLAVIPGAGKSLTKAQASLGVVYPRLSDLPEKGAKITTAKKGASKKAPAKKKVAKKATKKATKKKG